MDTHVHLPGCTAKPLFISPQVLEVTDRSSDPSFTAARRNALVNLAGLAFDMGDEDTAVAAYKDYLR